MLHLLLAKKLPVFVDFHIAPSTDTEFVDYKKESKNYTDKNKVTETPPVEGCITYSAWMNLYWINPGRSENPISSWDLKMF